MTLFIFVVLGVLCLVFFAWVTNAAEDFDKWEAAGKEMAKVPTPPEHLNPRNSQHLPSTPIPIERLKGEYSEEDTYWELVYRTRNVSDDPFRRESRAYMCLSSAKDEAIIYKKNPTFYRDVRIVQRLKDEEFLEEP